MLGSAPHAASCLSLAQRLTAFLKKKRQLCRYSISGCGGCVCLLCTGRAGGFAALTMTKSVWDANTSTELMVARV